MTSILEQQVTALLTSELGRTPTSAEITSGMISPWTLAQIHNSLNVTQSLLAVSPGDDLQATIDKLVLNGGGVLFLNPGTYNLTEDLILSSNIHIEGVGSGGSILDFGGGAFQIQVIGTLMTTVDSVFLQGFTVQNSTLDAIQVQYAFNFGGYDVLSKNCASGINLDNVNTFNWNVGYVDTCDSGMMMSNMTGMTIQGTFLTNILSGGGYVADTCTNSIIFNSSLDTVVGNGYDVTNCTNFGVEQVSILNVTGTGFLLNGGGQSFSITQGLIQNATGDGLKIENSCSQLQISAMQFAGNGGYGVNIADSGCTDNLFVGNTFNGNSTAAFNDSGTGTLIRSNIGVADN